ncbi:MAG: ribulose-5-phosphate reductase [Candidatus Improbicoccus pseudotrichonymphae]|uniref:Ribulose-5-phosphate reductase n=1 Tax=Candidatus Improbicoccus pseudotrichonymphae TaxID=3033792 RepID=A0AA48IAA0_9FIRM|nr:MAG: ribulose-5-phosphate reductase [Candidatus Improbicoccus pseudotrichonymphae]
MINCIYRLIGTKCFDIHYASSDFNKNILVRPEFMAICHADQRYYQGKRNIEVVRKKLPMALIHECCAKVIYDPTNEFKIGQNVILIPNLTSPDNNENHLYENYKKSSVFCSSGFDGFMQELVSVRPDRLLPYNFESENFMAITELLSVAVHATNRFLLFSHEKREKIAVFGDGSVSYLVSLTIKKILPKCKVVVIGKHPEKLNFFSFVEETYFLNDLPSNLTFDHAFECVGGQGSEKAIEDIINFISPQGTLSMLGVSEEKISINSRLILEKGVTLIGSSRSSYEDFVHALNLLSNIDFQNRIRSIVYEDEPVKSINDIHRVFGTDLSTRFKTVFRWDV